MSSRVTRLPHWLKRDLPPLGESHFVDMTLQKKGIPTVCREARCPNRGECYSNGTATFLIMGEQCSRNCGFCSISHQKPQPLDRDEPTKVAEAVQDLHLDYVVLTMVTRDDIIDGGASHICATVEKIKEYNPATQIEVLVPDFQGNIEQIDQILSSSIDLFNHNIEMPQRLYKRLRGGADYTRSLDILSHAKKSGTTPVKSGFMVGLGENLSERKEILDHLASIDIDIVTIGQYFRPSKEQVQVQEFVEPKLFKELKEYGESLGISHIEAGAFVRSSYNAKKIIAQL